MQERMKIKSLFTTTVKAIKKNLSLENQITIKISMDDDVANDDNDGNIHKEDNCIKLSSNGKYYHKKREKI